MGENEEQLMSELDGPSLQYLNKDIPVYTKACSCLPDPSKIPQFWRRVRDARSGVNFRLNNHGGELLFIYTEESAQHLL